MRMLCCNEIFFTETSNWLNLAHGHSFPAADFKVCYGGRIKNGRKRGKDGGRENLEDTVVKL